MSEASDFPRRLVVGGKSNGPIEIYGDDREFRGRGKIVTAPPPEGIAYIREEGIVDKMVEVLREARNVASWDPQSEDEATDHYRAVKRLGHYAEKALAAYEPARSENGIPRTSVQDAPHPGKEDADTCT